MSLQFKSAIIILTFVTLAWVASCLAQTAEQTPASSPEPQQTVSGGEQSPDLPSSGSINGTILDQTGAVVTGARVRLTGEDQSLNQEVLSGADGQFSFANIAPGPFELTITSTGFATQTFSGVLHSGEMEKVPDIVLGVATNVTEVQVGVPQTEVAEEQIKVEEKQRVLGAIPNFYVSYIHNAAPLSPKQKFELAWKTVIDPVTFMVVGGLAGVQQAQNHFVGYGQGAQGYAKRFGANYADTATGTFIGSAVLASLLKQDPRYFYKGTGNIGTRILYALANSVICRGDDRRWQPNYSNILGNLASGGISNLYYPAQDRHGAELTFENGAIGIGAGAFTNLLQEFVLRKLTVGLPKRDSLKP
jgi:Carboxypeptidase regulatory-like domain